jgi:AraC-like DNA-binding protein
MIPIADSAKNLTDCAISGIFISRRRLPCCSTNPPILQEAIRYIKVNLFNNPSITDIARHANTSPRNLQHLFQKHLEKSVLEFEREGRMSIAAGYLKMNFHISEIASLLGIGDISQFSRTFKKHYGISPKKYQQQYSSTSIIEGVVSY